MHQCNLCVSPRVADLLRVKQTSGQAIHALRRQDSSDTPQHKVTGADGNVYPTHILIYPLICIYIYCSCCCCCYYFILFVCYGPHKASFHASGLKNATRSYSRSYGSITLRYNYHFLGLSLADQALITDSKEDDVHHKPALTPSAFNCILYGLPNLSFS